MNKLPIIVDADPGIDDALALMLLSKHQKNFDIKLFCATAGNNPIEVTSNNLKYFALNYFNKVPVSIGASSPLVRINVESCEEIQGKGGLGTISIPKINYPTLKNESAEEMYNLLKRAKKKISIIALGAMTNIAKLLINHPEIKDKIERIYTMIGSVKGKGNVTPYAEFNAYFDADAFSIVANSGIPLTINPFDLAHNSKIKKSTIEELDATTDNTKFAKELLLGINEVDPTKISIFDLHSIVALYKPELYELIPCEINTFTDKDNCGKCILTKVKDSPHYYLELKDKNEANKFILDELLY